MIVAGPTAALGPTLIVSVDDALPEDGMLIGLVPKVENVTPEGTGPVTDSVTAPEYPSKLEPVIEIEFDAPCAIEIEPGLAFRPKSGCVSVSFAILLPLDSAIQTAPLESTTMS